MILFIQLAKSLSSHHGTLNGSFHWITVGYRLVTSQYLIQVDLSPSGRIIPPTLHGESTNGPFACECFWYPSVEMPPLFDFSSHRYISLSVMSGNEILVLLL